MAGRTIPEIKGGKVRASGQAVPGFAAGEAPSGSHNVANNKRGFCLAFQATLMIHRVGCLPTSRRSPIRTWPGEP